MTMPIALTAAAVSTLLGIWIVTALVQAHTSKAQWALPFSQITRDKGERSLGPLFAPIMLLLGILLALSSLEHSWALVTGLVLAALLSIALHERPLLPKGNSYEKNWQHLLYAGALFALLSLVVFAYSPLTAGKSLLAVALIGYLGTIFLGKGWKAGLMQKACILLCVLNLIAITWEFMYAI